MGVTTRSEKELAKLELIISLQSSTAQLRKNFSPSITGSLWSILHAAIRSCSFPRMQSRNPEPRIHLTEPSGDILVFLTGQEEIDTACREHRVALLGLGVWCPVVAVEGRVPVRPKYPE